MTTVTLADGRKVDSASEEWRLECLARHHEAERKALDAAQAAQRRHVANLMRLTLEQRRDYLQRVESDDGPEVAGKLRDAFRMAWEARRAQA